MAKLEPNQHFLEVAVIVSLMTCLFSIILPTASRQSFLFFTLDLSGRGSHCIGRSLTEEISMTSTISYEVIESILFRHIGRAWGVGGTQAFVQTVNGSNETADWISLLLLRKLKSSSDSVGNTKIIAVAGMHSKRRSTRNWTCERSTQTFRPSVCMYAAAWCCQAVAGCSITVIYFQNFGLITGKRWSLVQFLSILYWLKFQTFTV